MINIELQERLFIYIQHWVKHDSFFSSLETKLNNQLYLTTSSEDKKKMLSDELKIRIDAISKYANWQDYLLDRQDMTLENLVKKRIQLFGEENIKFEYTEEENQKIRLKSFCVTLTNYIDSIKIRLRSFYDKYNNESDSKFRIPLQTISLIKKSVNEIKNNGQKELKIIEENYKDLSVQVWDNFGDIFVDIKSFTEDLEANINSPISEPSGLNGETGQTFYLNPINYLIDYCLNPFDDLTETLEDTYNDIRNYFIGKEFQLLFSHEEISNIETLISLIGEYETINRRLIELTVGSMSIVYSKSTETNIEEYPAFPSNKIVRPQLKWNGESETLFKVFERLANERQKANGNDIFLKADPEGINRLVQANFIGADGNKIQKSISNSNTLQEKHKLFFWKGKLNSLVGVFYDLYTTDLPHTKRKWLEASINDISYFISQNFYIKGQNNWGKFKAERIEFDTVKKYLQNPEKKLEFKRAERKINVIQLLK